MGVTGLATFGGASRDLVAKHGYGEALGTLEVHSSCCHLSCFYNPRRAFTAADTDNFADMCSMLSGCDVGPAVRAMLGVPRPGHQFGSGNETAAQLDAHFGSGKETAAQLDAQFGSGNETAAQLAARLTAGFGGGKETTAQLDGRSSGGAKGGRAGKGGSKPGSGVAGGLESGERKTQWPEGTLMARCPKCGATGKKGNKHNYPRQQGELLRSCGRY